MEKVYAVHTKLVRKFFSAFRRILSTKLFVFNYEISLIIEI